jgi:hypothetical protein
MSITNRIERMLGRMTQNNTQLPQEANAPNIQPVVSAPVYQQWYDRDANLCNTEKESLEAKGFQAECTILPNAKACFTVTITGKRTALICGYAHPIEPVAVQMLDDVDVPSIVDEMGGVDIFAHDGFVWNTDIRLGDVAQRVATLLSVARMTSSGSKTEGHTDDAINDNLAETAGHNHGELQPPANTNNSTGLHRQSRRS